MRRNYKGHFGKGGIDHGAKPTALGRNYNKDWQHGVQKKGKKKKKTDEYDILAIVYVLERRTAFCIIVIQMEKVLTPTLFAF